VLAAVLLLALYAAMWGMLIRFLGTGPDRVDRAAPWARGVEEGEPVHYAVEALTPPAPPGPVEDVATSPVRAHVSRAVR
jgi:hypothetical protein